MKRALWVVLVIVGGGAAIVGAGLSWASMKVSSALDRQLTAHDVDIPMPWPLSPEDVDALRQERLAEMTAAGQPTVAADGSPIDPLADVDLDAIARQRALVRGEHLLNARYACVECHGADLGGGTMVDDPAVARLFGANLTGGKGSPTGSFTMTEWEHMVRHGIKHDGTPGVMPSEDYFRMSDQELSDLVLTITSKPAVDREVLPSTFGPVGKALVVAGKLRLAADYDQAQATTHASLPPEAAVNADFGRHLAGICTGCHRSQLEGGPIASGPPDWPPAANLTPTGLEGWSYDDFDRAMTQARRPDGTDLKAPMTFITPYAQRMTETERKALWAYIQAMPPQATGL